MSRSASMRIQPALLAAFLLASSASELVAGAHAVATTETTTLEVGQTPVRILATRGTHPGALLVNLHDNENTSVEAAKSFVLKRGGTVVELRHSGRRLITFELSGKSYTFDPNRIFTKVGIAKTLAKYGRSSSHAEAEVERFAKSLVGKWLSGHETIVAMHNNTNGGLSVLSYEKGGEYATDAAKVYANPSHDADDFFYVTEEKLFNAIMAKGFNVVLQNNASVTDDGSLSVFCGQGKIRYINVEAQHGHRAEQSRMLEALRGVLGE
jgi:hypothetical protein